VNPNPSDVPEISAAAVEIVIWLGSWTKYHNDWKSLTYQGET